MILNNWSACFHRRPDASLLFLTLPSAYCFMPGVLFRRLYCGPLPKKRICFLAVNMKTSRSSTRRKVTTNGIDVKFSLKPAGIIPEENRRLIEKNETYKAVIGKLNRQIAALQKKVVDPKGSGGEAAGILKIQQQLMASGQGVSYEAVSRDMSGVNYSSARQSTVEDGLTFAEEVELIRELLDEIYESFLISGYLAGVFDFPEFFINREKKHQYLTHQWVSSPKPWIDPIKEANANRIALENGIKTYQQIAAEQGRDWKEMLDEMIEVRDYCQEHKLHLGGDIYDYAGDETAAGAGE